MQILKFHLLAFGHFDDTVLDFAPLGERRPGLQIVYGPNEAGKSTTRRALRLALYGFRQQAEYNFLHDNNRLRLGMTIQDSEGEELTFLRRRGKGNTLLQADGQTPLPDNTLDRFLAGAGSAEEFEQAFAIGAAELRQGGAAILKEKGKLSELLFITSSGLPRVRAVERELSETAENLFRQRGKNQAINDALNRLKELRDRQQEHSLAASEFQRIAAELQQLKAQKAELEDSIHVGGQEHSRLSRYSRALPTAVRLRQYRAEAEQLNDVPLLDADFSERRRKLETEHNVLESRLKQNGSKRATVREQLTGIDVREELLHAGDEIERLFKELGSIEKATRDRRDRHAEANQLHAEADALLKQLHATLTLDEVRQLPLTLANQQEIRELTSARQELLARREEFEKQLERLKREKSDAEFDLQELPPVVERDALREAVRRANREGDLDERLQETRTAIARLRRKLDTGCQRLPGWSGPPEQVESLPVPAESTIDRVDDELSKLKQQESRLADKRQSIGDSLRRAEEELAQLQREGRIPSEADLSTARQQRDELWLAIRQRLQGEPAGNRTSADLAAAFEEMLREADDLADRLRREAKQVEQSLRLRHECDRAKAELERSDADIADVAGRREALRKEWQKLWSFLEHAPFEPRELRDWRAQHQTLLKLIEELHDLEQREAQLAKTQQHHRQELEQALRKHGLVHDRNDEREVVNPSEPVGLQVWVDRAETVLSNLEASAERRQAASHTLLRTARDIQAAEASMAAIDEKMQELRSSWGEWMLRLRLEPTTSPKQADIFLSTAATLFEKLEKAKGLQERIDAMLADRAAFAERTEELIDRVAPDLAGKTAEQSVTLLHEALTKARALREQRRERQASDADLTRQIEQDELSAKRVQEELATLCREANVADCDELPPVEQQSERKRQIAAALIVAERELHQHCGSSPLEEFLAELIELEFDEVQTRLEQLDAQKRESDRQYQDLVTKIARLETALSQMKGGAEAAAAAEQAEAVIAALERDISSYIRHKLALKLLRDARERYREKTGEPILDHASRLFRNLTDGAFASLIVDFAEDDSLVLYAVRADGQTKVETDGLSDGTADQLYLALRLAALHAWLDRHPPLPFVVDDLLIHFDDARARAALRTLAELSQRTQVIFFTHNEHLLDLVREALPTEAYRVHDLLALRGLPPTLSDGDAATEQTEDLKPRRSRTKAAASRSDTGRKKSPSAETASANAIQNETALEAEDEEDEAKNTDRKATLF